MNKTYTTIILRYEDYKKNEVYLKIVKKSNALNVSF